MKINVTNLLSEYKQFISRNYANALHNKTETTCKDIAFSNSCNRVISCLINENLIASIVIKILQFEKEQSVNVFWLVLYQESDNTTYKVWVPIARQITEHNTNYGICSGAVRYVDPDDLGQISLFIKVNNGLTDTGVVTNISEIFRLLERKCPGNWFLFKDFASPLEIFDYEKPKFKLNTTTNFVTSLEKLSWAKNFFWNWKLYTFTIEVAQWNIAEPITQ